MSPAAPAPRATAVAVPVALPITDPAQLPGAVGAPTVGLSGPQKGILGAIVNALEAFFAP